MGRYATTWFQTHLAAVPVAKEIRVWVGRRRFDDAWRQCPFEAWRPALLQAMGLWNIPAVVEAREKFNAKLLAMVTPAASGVDSTTVGETMFNTASAERRRRLQEAREAYDREVQAAEADFHATVAAIGPKVRQLVENDSRFEAERSKIESDFYAELVAALPPLHNPYWVLTVNKAAPKGYTFFEEGGPWIAQNDRPS